MSDPSNWSGARYVTVGIMEAISPELQFTLWTMVDLLRRHSSVEMDYLQVFELAPSAGPLNQTIVHTQEQPTYRATNALYVDGPVTVKVFIIFEADYATMMLAREY